MRTVTCTGNTAHTHDVRKITFQMPQPGRWTAGGPIVNMLVQATPELKRPYNPLSTDENGSFTLLVKRYENAKMGTVLHELPVGGTIEVKGPNQQWTYKQGDVKHFALVAGGTGITPLFQLAQHALANDGAHVTLVTFNKSTSDILLAAELAELQTKYPGRLTVTHVVEGGLETGAISTTTAMLEGAVSTQVVRQGKPSTQLLSELLPCPSNDVKVMVCGRPPMTAAVAGPKNKDFTQGEVGGILKSLGFSKSMVHKV